MTDHGLDHLDDLNLPIALRRTRRTGTGIATARRTASLKNKNLSVSKVACTLTTREVSLSTPPTTPLRQNRKKKKIISRGTGSKRHLSPGLEDELSLSTGLTPMVRRTSLQPQSQSPAAVPGSSLSKCTNHHIGGFQLLCSPRQHKQPLSFPERISKSRSSIRNIRRNVSLTMTENMNHVYNERRKGEKEAQEEIERLRAELREKNERIEGLMSREEVAVAEGKEKGSAVASAAVAVQQEPPPQQPRSPETPSNRSTFHTALSVRRRSGSEQDLGNGGQGRNGQHQQIGMGMPLQNHNDGPSSGSETEALSLTASQFGEAIRAQLDCSTPPPSGRSRPARHYHHRPHPLPTTAPTTTTTTTTITTTAAGGTNPLILGGGGTGAQLPITPCSNSRHDLDSRRTSNASTIRMHNSSINDDTPTRSRTSSAAPIAHHHHHHHHHQHQQHQHQDRTSSRPSSSSYVSVQPQPQQPLRNQQPLGNQQPLRNQQSSEPQVNHPQSQFQPQPKPQPQSSSEIQSLTTSNTTLQASLARTQSSLRIALQTVKKLQIESEQLCGEVLLLQQEKRESLKVITDVRSQINQAVKKRDKVWRGKMGRLREGIFEGVRGIFADVVNEEGLDSWVGVDEMEGFEVGRGSGSSLRKRKRSRQEESEDNADKAEDEDDQYEEEQQEEGDGNESCDLGSNGNWRSGDGSSRDSYNDGMEDMERRIMKMRARMVRKRRRGISGYVTAEVDSDPDA